MKLVGKFQFPIFIRKALSFQYKQLDHFNRMGACTSAQSKPKSKPLHELPPADIDSFDPSSTHLLSFEGSLNNVKIQNGTPDTPKRIGIGFKIPEVVDINCPKLVNKDGKIRWNLNTSFSFTSNEYELRAKFLTIEIKDQDDKVYSSIKINLYKIIVGPFHHNFKIGKEKNGFGRLVFDLKIAQQLQMSIQSMSTEVELLKQYPGEQFFYQLESYNILCEKSKQGRRAYSSYVEKIPLQKEDLFREATQQDQAPSPTTRIKRKGKNLVKIESASTLNWENSKQKKLPSFNFTLKVSDILSGSFLFKLYRFSDCQKKTQFGFCSLMLSDLLRENFKCSQSTNDEIVRTCKISKKFYNNGKHIGEVKLVFTIKCHKILKQISSRTLTEDGIVDMHHFEIYSSENSVFNSGLSIQINQFRKKCSQLEEATNKYATSPKTEHYKEISKLLQESLEFVQSTTKSTLIFYSSKTQNKVREKQLVSVRMLNILREILVENEGDSDLRDLCWKLCIAVMKRGELMLRNWGFSEMVNQKIQYQKKNREFQEKALIAEKYCEILFSLLKTAMDTEAPVRGEKENSEIFKAYCYFRIPLFRQKILETLQDESESNNIEELTDDISDIGGNKLCPDINWQKYFYDPLKNRPKVQELIENMQKYLENHSWLSNFEDKGGFFYDFVRYLIAKIVIIKEQHKLDGWRGFPGYDVFVKSALTQLRAQNLSSWTYQSILMCISLLQNQILLGDIIKIIYTKTNLYDDNQVRQMIGIMSQIFFQVSSKNRFSSVNFPYPYFTKGIRMIFQYCNNHLTLRLVLIFLFKFYQQFQLYYRKELTLYLLGGMFWKLFYNWSHEVRDVMIHIIVLKILQDQQLLEIDEISERLGICQKIMENSLYEAQKKKINEKTNKCYYEKMKDKLKKKKRGRHQRKFVSLSNDSIIQKQFSIEDLLDKRVSPSKRLDLKRYKPNKGLKKGLKSGMIELVFSENNLSKKPHFKLNNGDKISRTESEINLTIFPIKSIDSQTQIYYGFAPNQLKLTWIQEKQLRDYEPYFEVSVNRLKQVISLVEEYYYGNGELPVMEDKLQSLGVKIDKKDILPEQMHFEFFD